MSPRLASTGLFRRVAAGWADRAGGRGYRRRAAGAAFLRCGRSGRPGGSSMGDHPVAGGGVVGQQMLAGVICQELGPGEQRLLLLGGFLPVAVAGYRLDCPQLYARGCNDRTTTAGPQGARHARCTGQAPHPMSLTGTTRTGNARWAPWRMSTTACFTCPGRGRQSQPFDGCTPARQMFTDQPAITP